MLFELVWILSDAYAYSKRQIVDVLKLLVRTVELRVEDQDAAWSAIKVYDKVYVISQKVISH